jgi:hypothetical protein
MKEELVIEEESKEGEAIGKPHKIDKLIGLMEQLVVNSKSIAENPQK